MKNLILILTLVGLVASPAVQAESLKDQLGNDLVALDGKKLKNAGEESLKGKDIVAVYYSAHWCPPCRAFTPELAKFYDKAKKDYSNFELVFVSSDRSEDAMQEYMEWGKMNWLAVDFDEIKKSKLKSLAARGIPYMVVLDADGNVLLEKPKGKDWIHPSVVLKQLEDLLKEKGKKA